jgi:transcriptional regulator with XRE-family HTH domain
MKLEQKLLTQMVRRGLNGQRLSKVSGVSDSEISRILAGKSRPGLENAFRLARAVGVSLDFLADESLEAEPTPQHNPLSNQEQEILALAHALGQSQTVTLLKIISVLGYEAAMRRLLEAKPVIEVDAGLSAVTPVVPVTPLTATRANSA